MPKEQEKLTKNQYDIQYRKTHYKQIGVSLKFDFYDTLLDHTLETGETVSAFIRRAIEETIQRDKDKRYK